MTNSCTEPFKKCRKCGEVKALIEFNKPPNMSYCKSCRGGYVKDWEERNKEKVRIYRVEWHRNNRKKNPEYYDRIERAKRLKKHGLKLEWWDRTFEDQKGVCAICGKEETAKHQKGRIVTLSVDHNHVTGQVRGLLCRLCNTALHPIDADVEWAARAVAYISKYRT
jgi:hypothetical protein